jgi:toxin-antitoxin system PIN domain toxin
LTSYLLDANILISIIDREHKHHLVARKWFEHAGHLSWLTCPTTENGVIRVLSLPTYPRISLTPGQAMEALASLCAKGQHRFVPDDVSLLDSPLIDRRRLLTSKQVTDTYLLVLATRLDATLATLDRRLTSVAVPQGEPHLLKLLG